MINNNMKYFNNILSVNITRKYFTTYLIRTEHIILSLERKYLSLIYYCKFYISVKFILFRGKQILLS